MIQDFKYKIMLDKYRMYGWVPFHLSGIQKGIQFQHAVTEYGLKYGTEHDYQEWANTHKTSIILNGYTTNNNPHALEHSRGLQGIQKYLEDNFVQHVTFQEPDLNDTTTAVVAIFANPYYEKDNEIINELMVIISSEGVFNFDELILSGKPCRARDLALDVISQIHEIQMTDELISEFTDANIVDEITDWYQVRTWLSQFRLA